MIKILGNNFPYKNVNSWDEGLIGLSTIVILSAITGSIKPWDDRCGICFCSFTLFHTFASKGLLLGVN